MPRTHSVRTREDLERTIRALAHVFRTDAVVVVGSQSILVGWPDAPLLTRTSGEIDAYPANARLIEAAKPETEVSEEVAALFGEGSDFEATHGFYIDGVDERTATLPPDWQHRAVYYETVGLNDNPLRAIAPCLDDLIVSKLHRLSEKDKDFIRACHEVRPLDIWAVEMRFLACTPHVDLQSQAFAFLAGLPDLRDIQSTPSIGQVSFPPHPEGSHQAFRDSDGTVYIREWDEALNLFNRIGNTLDAAVVTRSDRKYFIDGVVMTHAEWQSDPRVLQAFRDADPEVSPRR